MGASQARTNMGLGQQGTKTLTIAAVKSDDTDLARFGRALWITAAGTIVIQSTEDADDEKQSYDVEEGLWSFVEIRRIWSTGTTATGYVAV